MNPHKMHSTETVATGLASLVLRASTPCCGRTVRLRALLDCPRESYARACACCGTRWDVLREMLPPRPGMRLDLLTWEKRGTR